MWVYKGTSLQQRLRLDRRIGFWLDYWLFLHSEETHPIWSARPVSTRAVAQAALGSTSGHDAALRRQLKSEILALVRLSSGLPMLPLAPSEPLPVDALPWPSTWLHWCEQLLSIDHNDLLSQLLESLAGSLAREDLSETAYYTSRIASELGDDEWSPNQLFSIAKRATCDSEKFSDGDFNYAVFVRHLQDIFRPANRSSYQVLLALAPVSASQSVINHFLRGPVLQVETDSNGRSILTGMTCSVNAAHPHQAVSVAIEQARRLLDALRLRCYVRSHICGAAKVLDTNTGEDSWFSLPQPFWSKGPGRRSVPRLPGKFDSKVQAMAESDQIRWHGARWHLSRAFSDWSEDAHGAAAECWQALEAFAPGKDVGLVKVAPMVPAYLSSASNEIAEHLATRVSLQARELKVLLEQSDQVPDWYYWDANQMELTKWYGRVLDERSLNYFADWRRPPAPLIGFDKDVGLLQIISRRIRDPYSEPWMEQRVQADLALLYGLRNKVIHAGATILPQRTAMYLGQLAAEVILALMEAASP